MSTQCELVEKPAQPVLSVRTHTTVQNLPQFCGKAYKMVAQYLGQMGEQPASAPFAIYYNMDMQNLDVEAGFPVSKKFPGKDEVKAGEIAAGKYVSCVFVGPYDKSEPAYTALTQFAAEKGYKPSGVAYEFYLNDPANTPSEQLQTQIMFPLVK